jgi:hypothetical protein
VRFAPLPTDVWLWQILRKNALFAGHERVRRTRPCRQVIVLS